MDGRGRALDNIFTERRGRIVKYEQVYLHDYASAREARQGLTAHLQFYNKERRHQMITLLRHLLGALGGAWNCVLSNYRPL